MVSAIPQTTDFLRDVLGRYTCNGLDEALRSADPAGRGPDGSTQEDARPFDVVVIGGGSFGPVFAQHLLFADTSRSHRILVLEGGGLVVPEHVQNLPMLGLGVPPATTTDPGGPRAEIWGLPWRSDVAFPGLAYAFEVARCTSAAGALSSSKRRRRSGRPKSLQSCATISREGGRATSAKPQSRSESPNRTTSSSAICIRGCATAY